MAYYLLYKINGINGQFVMPINQEDDVKYILSRVKKEFGIIPELKAKIYGSDLQSSSIISQCVQPQDNVTFDVKEKEEGKPKLEFYRHPIIVPRYQSKINSGDNTQTFIVFSTVNFQSMVKGDKLKIDIEKDNVSNIQNKIKNMISNKYKVNIDAKKILLFLPGGIPFLQSNLSDFIKSFPDYMPHIYAILITNPSIDDSYLEETYDIICNIKNPKLRTLISPDCDRETSGLCEIASVLGYIQHGGPHVKRMIYSIAKFCPFAPMICGLYDLACLSRANGRTVLQITAPLILLFKEMNKNIKMNDTKLFQCTIKFLTYFMNVKINDRVPCTEFVRPFYNIGFEKYFHDNYSDVKYSKIENVIAFDPDIRDQDWIRFELPSLTEEDFENAMENTGSLSIIPPMSLREMHRVSLFRGKNGPWLYLTASTSKEEGDKEKIDYINPEVGEIENDTYENIAVKVIGVDYRTQGSLFDSKVTETIDPKKVKQLVVICIDKSESMILPLLKEDVIHALELYRKRQLVYGTYEDRFTISQKFFTKFTQACYKYHNTSLYGSIMFNHEYEVRNELNPLVTNFVERMIISGEKPIGRTKMFTAMKAAAGRLLAANNGNKYPNAVLRIIVISDGIDLCTKEEMTDAMNFILENKIRVDGIIVSDEIAKELVAITQFTGGVSIFPRTLDEGLDFFNKEEFFNVDLRLYKDFRTTKVTLREVKSLPNVTVEDLAKNKIDTKQNVYANKDREVTSPYYAINEFQKEVIARRKGTIKIAPSSIIKQHPHQKRIILELRKMITNQDDDIRVYPLKDKVDVWRVLIRGFEGSLYDKKWFYLIIEFTPEYPGHYPLFRFVYPPFHPNITDQGLICIDTLDQSYRSDKSIRELIGEIRFLLLVPNFDSAVDMRRTKLKGNEAAFKAEVANWNEKNGRNNPEDWEKEWKIQADTELYKENIGLPIVPEQFICPITRRIMNEPVKATSGVYYEKVNFEKYLNSTPNPVCRAKNDEKGKPIPLNPDENKNLPVDNEMKTKINTWIRKNHYREDEEEGNEDDNIYDFRKKGKSIDTPEYPNDLIDSTASPRVKPTASRFNNNLKHSRARPVLSDV